MQYTNQYQFNLIESGDDFSAGPLNENAEKVENSLMQIQTALVAAGNCKIITGTYTGTGSYGSSSKCQLKFETTPLALFISGGGYLCLMLSGSATGTSISNGTTMRELSVTWDSNGTVSWYASANQYYQMNYSGTIYHYFALIN